MKKLFIALMLLTIGAYVLAQDTATTEETQNAVTSVVQKAENLQNKVKAKNKEEKQLTSAQKSKIIKKQLSKEKKLLKKKQKSENIIKINQKHLDYKKEQLEQFINENKTVNTENSKEKVKDNTTEEKE